MEEIKNSHQIGKDNHVFKLTGEPDQVQRVLVYRHLSDKRGGVVAADPGAAIRVHADAKVADAGL